MSHVETNCPLQVELDVETDSIARSIASRGEVDAPGGQQWMVEARLAKARTVEAVEAIV